MKYYNKKLIFLYSLLVGVFIYAQSPIGPETTNWRLVPTTATISPTDNALSNALLAGTDFVGSSVLAANSQKTVEVRLPVLTNGGMLIYSIPSDITGFSVDSYDSPDGSIWTTVRIGNYHNNRPDDLQKIDIPQSSSGKFFRVVFRNTTTASKNISEVAMYKFNSSGRHQYFVMLGASLTEPTGTHTSWKSTINNKLGSTLQPVIFNWALSGANTSQIIERTDEFLSQHPNAAYVLVETAGNDITSLRPMTYDRSINNNHTTLYNNIKLLITKIKGYGKIPVLSRVSYRNYASSTSWLGYAQPAVNAGLNQENGSLPYNFFMDKIIKEEVPEFYNATEGRGYLDFYQLTLNNPQILTDGTHIAGSEQSRVRNFWCDYGIRYIYTGERSTVVPYNEIVANIASLATTAVQQAEQSLLPNDVWNAKILVEQIASTTTRLSLMARLDNVGLNNVPPSIITHPSSSTVIIGNSASFSVAASGTSPITYQWQKNGSNIVGATSLSYSFITSSTDNSSTYSCVVTNPLGSVTSNSATLSVIAPPAPPVFTTQPSSVSVSAGSFATFTVAVSGTGPFSYQWQKNNVNISGATSASYSFSTVTGDNGTAFRCLVTNLGGTVTSNTATLTVTAAVTVTGSIVATTWTFDPAKNPGFTTTAYESYTYTRRRGFETKNLPFRLLRPTGYSATGPKYPLVIMLHGRGERGTDNNFHLKWAGKLHLDAVQNKTFDGFVLYPQEPFGSWANGSDFKPDGTQPSDALSQTWDLVDSMVNRYNIDPNRVYIHGLSSGGNGVWASLYNRPELFAAALPMCAPGDLTQIDKISTTPIWYFQGREDGNPRPWVVRPLIDALRAAGAINLDVTRYNEYPDVYHTAWNNAYAEHDFLPFMLRQNRKNLQVLGNNPFPQGGSVSLGVVSGMQTYEWFKDNVLVSGEGDHRLNNINQPGVYYARFKRKSTDTEWIVTNTVTISQYTTPNPNPILILSAPSFNSTYIASPKYVTLYAYASDPNGSVSKVEFFNGSTLLFTDFTAPYEYQWDNPANGTYTITARATDNQSATTSVSTQIYVGTISNTSPSVSFQTPASNANYATNSNINIVVNASDAGGSVQKVDFFANNIFIGSDNTSPYEVLWRNVSNATYTLTARAIDNRAAVSTATRTVTVSSSGNVAPITSITSPANNSVFTTDNVINITANASDANGSISKVEFYQGSTLLGTDNTSPYSFAWSNVPVGVYQITTRAFDNLSSVAISSAINVTVNSAVNILPTVALTSPTNNTTFITPASITLNATANDSDGSISSVEFYNGTLLIGTDNSAPYSFTWNGVGVGNYVLSAKAIDNRGGIGASSNINVAVNPIPNVPPSISITSPSSNSVYTAPASITISANATDVDGTVAQVDFYNGTELLGTDNSAPFSFVWNNIAVGNYTISARATDNSGDITNSTAIAIVVNPNVPPTVSLTSPLNGSTFYAPATIILTAMANDQDGSVSSVEFYNGTTLLGSDNTAPYSYDWTGVELGSYLLSARVIDNLGVIGTSTNISIDIVEPVPNQLPSVSLTSPTNNSTFVAPTLITLSATASDADGSISLVEFYNGAILLGSDNSAPYTFDWNIASAGSYQISAKAIDNSAGESSTTVVNITVDPAPNSIPVISLISPVNNSTFTSPASITLTASAFDADGSVVLVEFYNGTELLGYDDTAPYNYTLTGVVAGMYTLSVKAIDDFGNIGSSTAITVEVEEPAPNLPPTVTLTSPLNNASFTAPASITMTATASDADGSVSLVEFYNGTVLLGSDNTAPYSYTWTGIVAGSYNLSAKAIDNLGDIGNSTTVSVLVEVPAPNVPPTVTLTSPLNNATFTAPASITITATASDVNGSVTSVEFYNGAVLLGSDNTAPYSYAWTGVNAGTYTLSVKAIDNMGDFANSSSISVVVNPASTNNPTVNITAPSNGAVITVGTNVSISATASKPGGSISKVDFYNGSTLIATDSWAPYSTTIWNIQSGLYSITARATDNLGNVGVSTIVNFEVNYANTSFYIGNASCLSLNQNALFQLNADLIVNATKYTWTYSGTAVTVTPVVGANNSANVFTNLGATSGDLCVGVNYSIAPTYRKYCKTLTICPSGARVDASNTSNTAEATELYQDQSNGFMLKPAKDVKEMKLFSNSGKLAFELGNLPYGVVTNFGSNLSNGLYVALIIYSDGTSESFKIIK